MFQRALKRAKGVGDNDYIDSADWFGCLSLRNSILVAACAFLLLAGAAYTIGNAEFKTRGFSSASSNVAQFGTPLAISNDGFNARYPSVAASGSYVYVAWTEATHGIYFRK